MIISDDKKFVFVSIAKCASTSIRRRLGYFEDNWNPENKCPIEPLEFKHLWGMSKGYTYYRGV